MQQQATLNTLKVLGCIFRQFLDLDLNRTFFGYIDNIKKVYLIVFSAQTNNEQGFGPIWR